MITKQATALDRAGKKVADYKAALRAAQEAEDAARERRAHERTAISRELVELRLRERLRVQQLLWAAEAELREVSARRDQSVKASKAPRLDARRIDYALVEGEFIALIKQGHTRREANGILAQRGYGAASSIRAITKKIDD